MVATQVVGFMAILVPPLPLHPGLHRVDHHGHQTTTEGAGQRIPGLRKREEDGRADGDGVLAVGLVLLERRLVDDVVQQLPLEQHVVKHHDFLIAFQLLKCDGGRRARDFRLGDGPLLRAVPEDLASTISGGINIAIIVTSQKFIFGFIL